MSERTPYKCARGERCTAAVPKPEQPSTCECECHGQSAMNRVCSIEGGCGHLHEQVEPELEGGAILNEAGLCMGCTRRVAQALGELPMDYTELHFLLASGESGITADVVMGSKELEIPIRVSIEALQSTIVHEAQAWAEPLAEKLGIRWDTGQAHHCRPGFVLQRCTRLLGVSVDEFLRLPEQEYRYAMDAEWIVRDGIGGALELMRLHDMVRFAAGKTKLVHEMPAPCLRCHHMTMVRDNGSDTVHCRRCEGRWSEDYFNQLVNAYAERYYRKDSAA